MHQRSSKPWRTNSPTAAPLEDREAAGHRNLKAFSVFCFVFSDVYKTNLKYLFKKIVLIFDILVSGFQNIRLIHPRRLNFVIDYVLSDDYDQH